MKRETKGFKVVKTTFILNEYFDYGLKEEHIETFDNITDAEAFCENNLTKYVKDLHDTLEVQRVFNTDNVVYVERSYCL